MLNFYIPNRLKDEKIILLIRRHPFVIFIKIAVWSFVAIVPFIFYQFFGQILINFLPLELVGPISVLFISLYYLYIWLFAFFTFVDYYLDVWIVTNSRIIDIEQKGLFNRVVSEQKLYRVQDVTSEIKGFFSTFLNFGNVYVQTAGEQSRFIFKQVPRPSVVAKKITQIAEESKKFHNVIAGEDKINL